MTCSVCSQETCGCCAGILVETPRVVDNRAGLPEIRYRVGEYPEFRASVHAALSSSEFAALAALQTRDHRDFTIGLIDAFACAADVLTFYQERLIQESFLGTAVERLSLQQLGKLVGYRLRRGVAAETDLAFALETPPAPPAAATRDPGSFVTGVPQRLSIPSGLRVDSVPGPGEKPQTFETVAELSDARPAWNALRPWLVEAGRLHPGDDFVYVRGVDHALRTGDGLLFVGPRFVSGADPSAWEFRTIRSVTVEHAARRTFVRFTRRLPADVVSRLGDAEVFVFRRRVALFGHNAPAWEGLAEAIRISYGTSFVMRFNTEPRDFGDWPEYEASAHPDLPEIIDLDTVYPDVTHGSYVVLARGAFDHARAAPAEARVELYRVETVTEASQAALGLTGKVTRLELRGSGFEDFRGQIRGTSVFAVSEQLELADYPVKAPVADSPIPVVLEDKDLFPGRRLVVRGRRASDEAVVAFSVTLAAEPQGADGRFTLDVDPPLPEPLIRESVVVFGNVVPAIHGETVSQVLGSGSGAATFQRFELAEGPLTQRTAPTELGVQSDLTVRVNDVAWEERASLFGSKPRERRYVLDTDEQGRTFVVFGDGIRGARLPTGSTNVRAVYRRGLGTEGNVAAEKLTQLASKPLGVKSVTNPLAAEGGTDAESMATARRSIPLGTRTLGRAVSLLDYEDFARAFAGVAKAQAAMLNLSHGRVVALTVLGAGGAALTPSSPVYRNLLAALRASGDPTVELRLLSGDLSTFRLGIRVRPQPGYEPKQVLSRVEQALRSRYSFDARELGAPVFESEVVATAQSVPGVLAVDLTALYRVADPIEQTVRSQERRLLASRMRIDDAGLPRPAELLTLASEPLDSLEIMP